MPWTCIWDQKGGFYLSLQKKKKKKAILFYTQIMKQGYA